MSVSDESASPQPEFTYNPKHAIGTCSRCGEEMIWNVPRLGPDGGFVHKANARLLCADQFEYTTGQISNAVVEALDVQ